MKQSGDESTITTPRQFEVAMLLYDRRPRRARALQATGSLLGLMEKRGIIEALPGGTNQGSFWTLTPKGREETRRCRKDHPDWLVKSP